MKIIKIIDGLYRTEDAGFRITNVNARRGGDWRWEVVFTNFLGAEVRHRFKNLVDVRAWLKTRDLNLTVRGL